MDRGRSTPDFGGDVVLLEKGFEFFGTEIWEERAIFEEKCRCKALPGEINHLIVIGAIGDDIDEFVLIAAGVKPFPGGNAPWAPNFDV